jgi:hypothetical protein
MGRKCGIGDRRVTSKLLVGKSDGKRRRGRCKHIFENNIKMYLLDIDWNDLVQHMDRWRIIMDVVIIFRVP